MTNAPGDEPTQPQQPQQPSQDPSGQQPGYWEQQQPPQGPPYGEGSAPPPYGQPYAPAGQYGQQYAPQYGQQPGYQPTYATDHPKATTALILGILGIVVCGFVAPFAWRIGKRTVDEIDASQGRLGGRGSAQAGYILGLIGTALLALGLLVLVGILVLTVIGTTTNGTTY
jgi:hypothetical protein